jgi:hypothetical protein
VAVELLPVVRGKGSYGRVYEGMYGGQLVAVKLMNNRQPWGLDADPTHYSKAFAQEVEVR